MAVANVIKKNPANWILYASWWMEVETHRLTHSCQKIEAKSQQFSRSIFFLEHSSHLPCWGLFSCFFYLQGSLHHVWNKPMRSPVHQEGGGTWLASWIPPNRSLFYLVLAPLLATLLVQYYISRLWAETMQHLSKGAWESYCHLLAVIALLQSS